MTSLISLGAINKITREYVYPKIANKKDEYICPDCNRDLILCQGDIRVHHFRHKVDTVIQCQHYNNPTESQIHKDAKMLLKTILEKKIPLSFIRNCSCCKKNEEFEIPEVTETSCITLEHRFEYNGLKIADVAYINNNKLLCIFEICNTHKTSSENRPEPWFEIDALELIKAVNNRLDTPIKIICIRRKECDICFEKNKLNPENIEKCKIKKATDILYEWFQNPTNWIETGFKNDKGLNYCELNLPPFYTNCDYSSITKQELSKGIIFDSIRYNKSKEYIIIRRKYTEYIIKVSYEDDPFENERQNGQYVHDELFVINPDWILSQTQMPKEIMYRKMKSH